MKDEDRLASRKELDALTEEFLAKGGQVMRCPPGSSEAVTYRFRRRSPPKVNSAETFPQAIKKPSE